MITLKELNKWTGVTAFEILMHIIAIFVSSVLIVLRWGFFMQVSFWQIFMPLYVASILNIYFLFISTLRFFFEEKQLKKSIFHNAFNFLRASTIGLFEMLICQKIEGDYERGQVALQSSYAIIFMPIWILMISLGFSSKLINLC